jgi:hypothetical protein
MNRTDTLLSFNANRGTDSYSQLPQVLFPLAYNIREYSFFRVEGLVGKSLDSGKHTIDQLREVLRKFNIALRVVAVDISCVFKLHSRLSAKSGTVTVDISSLSKLYGLERMGCLQPGHTLVIIYTGVDEQIELSECRKDITPEITKNTIVGDFTLPYRLTEEFLASFQHLKGIIDIHI